MAGANSVWGAGPRSAEPGLVPKVWGRGGALCFALVTRMAFPRRPGWMAPDHMEPDPTFRTQTSPHWDQEAEAKTGKSSPGRSRAVGTPGARQRKLPSVLPAERAGLAAVRLGAGEAGLRGLWSSVPCCP